MIFIPTDRVGLGSFQKSISHTAAVINDLLDRGYEIRWHTGGFRLSRSSRWPEGHDYQCGFSLPASGALTRLLDAARIRWEETEDLPGGSVLCLKKSKIALYNGTGAGPEFSAPLTEVLEWGGFRYALVDDAEIRAGKLMEYDILLVPGSPDAGECYYAGLGDLGQDRIRYFLKTRGQYMGICGGAYLPLTAYSPSNPTWLNAVEATEDEDLDFWHKGSGLVRCRVDEPAHPIFAGVAAGELTTINITYWEGPAIRIVGSGVRSLGHFERLLASGHVRRPQWDFLDNALPKEAALNYYNPLSQELFDKYVLGRTAFAEADYHGHRILMYSPHPEMGNIGSGPRADSLNFQLIYNGLFYLGAQNV